LGQGNSFIIAINGSLNKSGTVVSFEAADDPLIFGLDMRGEVWLKILNANVLKVFGNNMARKVVLKKENFLSPHSKVSIPFLNPVLI
jgi:hypothetical protein